MNPGDEVTDSTRQILKDFVGLLVRQNVKLLCLDFDLTVLSIHTGGVCVPSNKCRPVFIELFKEAAKVGLKTCITTFHPKHDDVRNEVASAVGIDPSTLVVVGSSNVPNSQDWMFDGKIPHIKQAWKLVYQKEDQYELAANVSLDATFLIDDDDNNVANARRKGVHSVHLDPEENLEHFLQSISFSEAEGYEKFLKKMHKLAPAISFTSSRRRKKRGKRAVCKTCTVS